ncbi:hypothetical protein [Methylobacterium aquaticum]|uniref:hypothetical protein n=1 Tax=Methylobacterium aquaticum TaxID=270351 RepID=UPI001933D55E|nr:hypothetical protein [Methylobacterium aquaticum]QRE76812.1 hypothetical protein F1D61_27580 [Methylobacterium aquaticum]
MTEAMQLFAVRRHVHADELLLPEIESHHGPIHLGANLIHHCNALRLSASKGDLFLDYKLADLQAM